MDPFNEPVCVRNTALCYGAGTCTPAACVPRGCAPALSCRAQIGPDNTQCAFNATIQGRTCAIHAGFDARAGSHASLGATAQVSNGSVRAEELENAWFAPGVEGRASLAGTGLGEFYAGAYRSDIATEGPRGGISGMLVPSKDHTWTEIGVAVSHSGGATPEQSVLVGIELLDLMPEGCFVRSAAPFLPDLECPPLGPIYPSTLP